MRDQSPSAANESEDELAADIVSVGQYAVVVPAKKRFLPWHRPRKRFVRHEQWCYQIKQLLNEGHLTDTITYFGLPGVDLLDLRCFGDTVCQPRDLKLRFLGFNKAAAPQSDDQPELNISLDELSKSPTFDVRSEIVPDDIRQLAKEDSIAWRKTVDCGPYDVVNLDLCDGLGEDPPDFTETYYSAVNRLLSVQFKRKAPWLLLLTTRVDKDRIHALTLDRLSELYHKNLEKCESFLDASRELFAIKDGVSLKSAMDASVGVRSVFLVGICKWLLGFAIGQTPPLKFEVKSVYGYRVRRKAEIEDMVSIAFRFDPTFQPLPDTSRLTSVQAGKVDECELATKALRRVGGLFDVDEYLSSEASVMDEMINAMCDLLGAARYDVDEYRRWVAAFA